MVNTTYTLENENGSFSFCKFSLLEFLKSKNDYIEIRKGTFIQKHNTCDGLRIDILIHSKEKAVPITYLRFGENEWINMMKDATNLNIPQTVDGICSGCKKFNPQNLHYGCKETEDSFDVLMATKIGNIIQNLFFTLCKNKIYEKRNSIIPQNQEGVELPSVDCHKLFDKAFAEIKKENIFHLITEMKEELNYEYCKDIFQNENYFKNLKVFMYPNVYEIVFSYFLKENEEYIGTHLYCV